MILTPAPLQRPAAQPLRPGVLAQVRAMVPARPVLQSLRAPRQLCLDLQPRLR